MAEPEGGSPAVHAVVAHHPSRVLVALVVVGSSVVLVSLVVWTMRSGSDQSAAPATVPIVSPPGSLPMSLIPDMAPTAEVFRWEDRGGMVSPNVDEAKFPMV